MAKTKVIIKDEKKHPYNFLLLYKLGSPELIDCEPYKDNPSKYETTREKALAKILDSARRVEQGEAPNTQIIYQTQEEV